VTNDRAALVARLRRQLKALNDGPPSRRRKFVLHEWVCVGCDELVMEVIATSPYRVLRYRQVAVSDAAKVAAANPPPTPGMSMAQAWYADQRSQLEHPNESIRRDKEWRFVPLPDARPDHAERRLVIAACRCQRVHCNEGQVFDALASDTRKTALRRSRT
jgi:hypothetical protein